PAALAKMVQVHEADGNRAALAKDFLGLGSIAEKRGDFAGALQEYRRAVEADPSNVEAATKAKEIGTPAEIPSKEASAAAAGAPTESQEFVIDLEDSASVHAPQPKVPSIEYEEKPAPPPPAVAAPPPPPEPVAAAPAPAPAAAAPSATPIAGEEPQ